jgi:ligand-binding sensor domain-containing protein
LKIFRTLSICSFLLGLVTTAHALNPETHISQYRHTVWRVQEGDLSGNPTAFVQTPDGYLWVGTEGGLYRFDGVSFVESKQGPRQFSGAPVQSLYVSRDGSLWVGYVGAIMRLKNGRFMTIWRFDGAARGITEDQEGTVWFIRSNMTHYSGPICKLSENKPYCYGEPDGIQTPTGVALAKDKEGRFWFGGDGTLTEWDGKLIHEYLLAGAKKLDLSHTVAAVAIDNDGTMWVGVAAIGTNGGLQRFGNGKWTSYSAPGLNGADVSVLSILIDRDEPGRHPFCLW